MQKFLILIVLSYVRQRYGSTCVSVYVIVVFLFHRELGGHPQVVILTVGLAVCAG
jgi:hypothetical protein